MESNLGLPISPPNETNAIEYVLTMTAVDLMIRFGFNEPIKLDEDQFEGVSMDEEDQEFDPKNVIYRNSHTTDFIVLTDDTRVQLDTAPSIDGKVVRDLGYVALHIETHIPNTNDVIEYRQLVFKPKNTPDGPSVYIGDDESLERITDHFELFEVMGFLTYIKEVCWELEADDADSTLNTLTSIDCDFYPLTESEE